MTLLTVWGVRGGGRRRLSFAPTSIIGRHASTEKQTERKKERKKKNPSPLVETLDAMRRARNARVRVTDIKIVKGKKQIVGA